MGLLQQIKNVRATFSAQPVTKLAISHHPELDGRVHMYSSINNSAGAVLEDFADYARVYGVYPWVYKALNVISDNISPLPVGVVNVDGEWQDNHLLTQLFANVNDSETPIDLWASWIVYKFLGGECPIQVVLDGRGRPSELWARRPDYVNVLPDKTRLRYPSIAEYTYDPKDGEQPMTLPPNEMIFDKFKNPVNQWRGIAPISAVREGIIIDLFAQMWSKQFLRNSARPDFAIVAPQGITETEKDRYLTQFLLRHRGPEGAHLPIVLEEGVTDIKTFSFAPKDIEWLQQREYSRDEVGAVFGVPDEIMGYGRDTYENFQTAMEVFWTLTCLPLVRRRDVTLTNFFAKYYPAILRPGERIETDVTEVGVLQEDAAPKVDIAARLWRMGINFNTLDERLNLGIGEVEGGEVAYVDSSVVPLAQLSATLDQMRETLETMRNPQPQPTQEQPTQDPARNNDTQDDANVDDVVRSALWRVEAKQFRKWLRKNANTDVGTFLAQWLTDEDKKTIKAEVSTDADFFTVVLPKVWIGDNIPDAADSIAAFKQMVLTLGDGEDDDAERRAREAIERAATDNVEKALRKQQREIQRIARNLNENNVIRWMADDLEQAFKRSKEEYDLYDTLRRALLQSTDLGVSVAVAQFESIGYGFDWTLANDAARRWAEQYAGELVSGINATSLERTRRAVSAWVENGESLGALIEDLVPIFGRGRAELIASTEVTRAYAEANRIAYKQNGVTRWEWRTAVDERVCRVCGPLHLQTIRIDENFDELLPDESRQLVRQSFSAPPAHPRCRCFAVPVID